MDAPRATGFVLFLALFTVLASASDLRISWLGSHQPQVCSCGISIQWLTLENAVNAPLDVYFSLLTEGSLSGTLPQQLTLQPYQVVDVPFTLLASCDGKIGNRIFSMQISSRRENSPLQPEQQLTGALLVTSCKSISLSATGAAQTCPDRTVDYSFNLVNNGKLSESGDIRVIGVNPVLYTLSSPRFTLASGQLSSVHVLFSPPPNYSPAVGDSLTLQAVGSGSKATASVPLKGISCAPLISSPTPTPAPQSTPTPSASSSSGGSGSNFSQVIASSLFPAATGFFTFLRSSLTATAVLILLAIAGVLYLHSRSKQGQTKEEKASQARAQKIARQVRGR